MQAIYLDSKDVPATLRGNYTGKKFQVEARESMTIPADAGLWSGGSRDTFRMVNIATGAAMVFPGQDAAPWDNSRTAREVNIPDNGAVIEHSMFCGKDMGLTIYVRPESLVKLLPPPATDLSELDALVINATCSYKASYAGKNRYQMARDHRSWQDRNKPWPTETEWNAAKQSLADRGYLNKAGAITTKGKNANVRK